MNASTPQYPSRVIAGLVKCLGIPTMHHAMALLGRLVRFMEDPLGERIADVRANAAKESGRIFAVLVIDASASMSDTDWPPSRLHAAQDAAKQYVRRLRSESPNARVGVVAYSTKAKTIAKLTLVDDDTQLANRIDRIIAGSWTNITAGLQRAESLLKRVGGRCQVVLLTDGEHNQGSKPHRVAKRLRSIATLETVGIGGSPDDVDEELLKEIASANPDGSKRYRWIGDKEQLVRHFESLAERLVKA